MVAGAFRTLRSSGVCMGTRLMLYTAWYKTNSLVNEFLLHLMLAVGKAYDARAWGPRLEPVPSSLSIRSSGILGLM